MQFLKIESFHSFSLLSVPVFESYESNIHYTCWKYDMKLNIFFDKYVFTIWQPRLSVCMFVNFNLNNKTCDRQFFFDDNQFRLIFKLKMPFSMNELRSRYFGRLTH